LVDNEYTRYKFSNVFEVLTKISDFHEQTVLIKYGGHAMIDDNLKRSVVDDIVLLNKLSIKPVIVHGGGPAISNQMERVGLEPIFIDGQRKTDSDTLEIAEMVLSGKINKDIVKLIQIKGVKSIGLSGKDGGMITVKKYFKEKIMKKEVKRLDLGFVGEVVDINLDIINMALKNDYIPVIAPICIGEDDLDYNVNADILAGELAARMKASKLVYLTDVNGILNEPGNNNSGLSKMDIYQAKSFLGKKINGGMIPKVESAIKAIIEGVGEVHIINGTTAHSILSVFVDDLEVGTTLYKK
jgi:acetylglutamate kinase